MNRILSWFLIALIFAMSGPLQAASMASAPGFRKPLYGRFAPWADKYAYCGGDPINASDPSGLDLEIYLKGKKPPVTFDVEHFPNAGPFIEKNANRIRGFKTVGHSSPNFAGIDLRDDHYSGIYWDKNGEKVRPDGLMLFWEDPNGQEWQGEKYSTYDLSNVNFPNLEFSQLWGCNTSGGHPDPSKIIQRSPNKKAVYDWPAGDQNIAQKLSRLGPRALVTGQKGPFFGGPVFTVPGKYKGGKPVP